MLLRFIFSAILVIHFAHATERKPRTFSPIATQKKVTAITPTHAANTAVHDKCLATTSDFNISELFPKGLGDDQGDLGSCVGYSATDSLEIAWWRYNQSAQLNFKEVPSPTAMIPFLTEPIFYEVKNEFYKRHGGILESDILGGVKPLIEGDFLDRFTAVFVDMLKKKQLQLYPQKKGSAQVCQAKASELRTQFETLLNTPENAALAKQFQKQYDSTAMALYLDSPSSDGESLRTKIHNAYEKYLTERTSKSEPLEIEQDFFTQLNAYRIKLPQHNANPTPCDPEKLKRTFVRYLCAGIPTSIGSLIRFENNEIKIDAAAELTYGHAMLLNGYKAATATSPFKLILKNSHADQQEVEVTPEDLCPAIQSASMIMNTGNEGKASTSDFLHLPIFDNKHSYEIERGFYTEDGLLTWGVASTETPDSIIEDPKAIRRPLKVHQKTAPLAPTLKEI